MRFDHLGLTRYGHFSDMSLDFEKPVSGYDFHVVLGPNEGGKSTIRQAIRDLLFGFPTRSEFGFLHGQPSLRIDTSISNNEQVLAFSRLKKSKGDLRATDDTALDPLALLPFLGATDKALFDRMFCFDRDQLAERAKQMLDQNSDAGQILFESSAGIQGLSQYRKHLEDAASELYAPKKKTGRAFYDALDKHKAAASRVKTIAQDALSYQKLKKGVESAEAELQSILKKLAHVNAQKSLLLRVRSAAPLLRDIDEIELKLKEHAGKPSLPENAATTLTNASRVISIESDAIERESERHDHLKCELELLDAEAPYLAAKDQIEEFIEFAGTTSKHESDIQAQRERVKQIQREMVLLCEKLGWSAADCLSSEFLMPKILQTKSLKPLAAAYLVKGLAIESAEQNIRDKTNEILELTESVKLIAKAPPEPVTDALANAQRIIDGASERAAATQELERLKATVSEALLQLAPWSGTAAELAALNILDESVAIQAKDQKLKIQSQSEVAKGRIYQLNLELSEIQADIEEKSGRGDVISPVELEDARAERDQVIDLAFSGANPSQGKENTKSAVTRVDGLSDKMYMNAEASHQLATLQKARLRIRDKVELTKQEIESYKVQQEGIVQDWATQMQHIGLRGIVLEQYSGWIKKRDHALQLMEQLRKQTLSVEHHTKLVSESHEHLIQACQGHNISIDDGASLEAIVLAVAPRVRKAQQAEAQHIEATKSLDKAKRQMATLSAAQKTVIEEQNRIQEQWQQGLESAGLSQSTQPETIDILLETSSRVEAMADDIERRKLERIGTMTNDLDHLKTLQLGIENCLEIKNGQFSVKELVAHLKAQLTQQQLQVESRKQRQEDLRKIKDRIDTSQRKLKEQRAELTALHALAHTASDIELEEAINASREIAGHKARLLKLQGDLQSVSDGHSQDELIQEIDATDIEAIPVDILNLDALRETYDAQRTAAMEVKIEAQQSLATTTGSDEAAQEEARRLSASSDIQEAIDQYLKIKTRERLLAWGIDWFRREKQGPLLQRSGELFAQITGGGFDRLAVDASQKAPKLVAIRSHLPNTAIEGMSEGTRDQLYLSLRIAAVEQHVANATALPFIADDLFMSFDDNRSMLGFEILKELSKHTQVIYFTHHPHMADLAQRVSADCGVARLDSVVAA